MENIITVTLAMEKATKNCVKFAEKTASEFVPEILGSLYVQKSALAEIQYNGGDLIVEISANTGVIKFVPEKATKNTWKFAEVVANDWTPEKIGSIYIPKSTLAKMGFNGGDIYVSMKIPE